MGADLSDKLMPQLIWHFYVCRLSKWNIVDDYMLDIHRSAQAYGNSHANVPELPQLWAKPSIYLSPKQ